MIINKINIGTKSDYNNLLTQKFENKEQKSKPLCCQELSFQQAQGLKNSILINKPSFQGRIFAPAFDAKDVEIIQNLMNKCRYGKKDLIYGDISNIKLKKTNAGYAIENFYTKDTNTDGTITGICDELSLKMATRIQKIFGDKYIPIIIHGTNKEFPQGHTYIGMFNNNKTNQSLIDRNFILRKMIMDEIEALTSSNLYIEVQTKAAELIKQKDFTALNKLWETKKGQKCAQAMDESEEKINRLKSQMRLFNVNRLKDCLLIDPSFNRIQQSQFGDLFADYSSHSITGFGEKSFLKGNLRKINEGLPLGYLKDIIPELANEKNGQKMVIIFHHINKILSNIEEPISAEHPFNKFLAKLNEGLAEVTF